jgi:cyclophilin family peptidyl-prolyl cis-trans isomerase
MSEKTTTPSDPAQNLTYGLGAVLLVMLAVIGWMLAAGAGPTGRINPDAGEAPPKPETPAVKFKPDAEVGSGRVVIETTKGDITVELDPVHAPVTVKNFLGYVDGGHYEGTVFHRVIEDFMIQGGGFDARMVERPTAPPIRNEAGNGKKNLRGTIAMARTGDPDSASAQFFINVKDNPFLDRAESADGVGYAVFGKVTDGLDVVDAIRKVRTGGSAGMSDVPVEPVVIKKVRRL